MEEIEEVLRRFEFSGVRFGLSGESCLRAVSLARREAVPGAEAAADDLVDALGLELSAVVGVLEYLLQNVSFGPAGAKLGPYARQDAYNDAVFLPFDSEPAVQVSVGLQMSYGVR